MQKGPCFARSPIIVYGTWLCFCVFLYFYLHLFTAALIDDAFITLQYVKTLLSSGTWGFFPGRVANSATSPFNVILLAIVSLFSGPTPEAAIWLYFLCMLCIAFTCVQLARLLTDSEIYGWIAVAALLFNPLLISTAGLESILLTALFVVALYCYQLQKWTLLAVVSGLLTLTRMEGVLFFLVFLLFVSDKTIKIRMLGIYVLSILPWYLFSWVHLGSLIPDTFFIKTDQGSWQQWDFFNGLTDLYYAVYPLATLLSFALLPLSSLLFNKKIREVTILMIIALTGVLHFAAYSLLRVPPFHWYYVPEVITIILFGSLGLGRLHRISPTIRSRRLVTFVTVVSCLVPVLGMLFLLGRDHLTVRQMPIHSNWGTFQQYREIGLWLKEHHQGDTIRLAGAEIGTLTYYCDCRLLDRFSDRSWLNDYIARHRSAPGLVSWIWGLNFAFFPYPEAPVYTYTLRAYRGAPDTGVEILKEWRTSTKWAGQVFLRFLRD